MKRNLLFSAALLFAATIGSTAASAEVKPADVAGDYTVIACSYLPGNEGERTYDVTIDAVSETEIEIKGLIGSHTLTATVSESGDIIIPRQYVYTHSTAGDVYFVYEQWNDVMSGGVATEEPLVGHFTNDRIVFNQDDLFTVQVPGVGYLMFMDSLRFNRNIEEAWEDYGTVKLYDGWICPVAGINPFGEGNALDVELQRDANREGVYRLVNPYKNHPASYLNISNGNGYIQFNIANPECPFVYTEVKSGFAADDFGDVYCYDVNGYYLLVECLSEEALLSKGDKIELSKYDPATGTLDIPTALVGFSVSDINGAFQWNTAGNVDMHSRIVIDNGTGIGAIESSNDAVEYYTLQGLRVANPENGIFIRRQGSKTDKVIIR